MDMDNMSITIVIMIILVVTIVIQVIIVPIVTMMGLTHLGYTPGPQLHHDSDEDSY